MTINFDKTYCASPDCVGACGRKLPNNTPQELLNRIWFGYFCGEPVNKIEKQTYNPNTCRHEYVLEYGTITTQGKCPKCNKSIIKNHLPNATKMV